MNSGVAFGAIDVRDLCVFGEDVFFVTLNQGPQRRFYASFELMLTIWKDEREERESR
jgi:hypothetical protein